MRVMVFVKATAFSERGLSATQATLDSFKAMDAFVEALTAAGVFVAAAGLKPSAAGKRIGFDGAARTVHDGPFSPAGELVAGFFIWEVASMDDAVAWARRCPNPMPGPSELEIRPFYEAADLAGFVPDHAAERPGEPPRERPSERDTLGVA